MVSLLFYSILPTHVKNPAEECVRISSGRTGLSDFTSGKENEIRKRNPAGSYPAGFILTLFFSQGSIV